MRSPCQRFGVKQPARLTLAFRPLDGQLRRALSLIGQRAMGGVWGGLLCALILTTSAQANPNDWKSQLKKVSGNQYKCWLWIIIKESNGNPDARNGSHYGLWQVRNEKLGTSTPVQQINYMKKYMDHRYNGDCMLAKAHHMKHNWW